MFRFRIICCLWVIVSSLQALPAGAQEISLPPERLHEFFCHPPQTLPTAWESWLRREKPKKLFLPTPHYDFGMTTPLTSPATPEDDPFGKTLKVYNQNVYVFGLSGAKGFNLRNWPRSWPQIVQFLRGLNLRNLQRWLPQPESNPLRMQNLIGGSFYFYF